MRFDGRRLEERAHGETSCVLTLVAMVAATSETRRAELKRASSKATCCSSGRCVFAEHRVGDE